MKFFIEPCLIYAFRDCHSFMDLLNTRILLFCWKLMPVWIGLDRIYIYEIQLDMDWIWICWHGYGLDSDSKFSYPNTSDI